MKLVSGKILMKIFSFTLLLLIIAACSKQDEKAKSDSETIFDIIYISNLNGAIENCQCGDPPLGGLDRIATVVKTLRSKINPLLVIDGGDTFNSYPFKELNQAIVNSYNIILPDIWAIAEQEFIEGKTFLLKNIKNSSIPILTSNFSIPDQKTNTEINIPFNGDIAVVVLSYLQPELMKLTGSENQVIFRDNNEIYRQINKKNYNILLFHGTYETFLKKKSLFDSFDLVLLAHQVDFISDTDEKPAIIGGLFDGEKLIHISLQKAAQGFIIEPKLIEITTEISPDPSITGFIKKYKENALTN